jgi:transcriptional regulator with XRE-family HTH domain
VNPHLNPPHLWGDHAHADRTADNPALLLALGRGIAARRRGLHESQDGFARRVGLHRTYVGALERGEKNASLLTLAVVAGGLGVPIAALVTDAGASRRDETG